MAGLSPRGRRTLLAVIVLYAVVTVPLAVHKGEDIASEFAQSDLLLRGAPVYLVPQNQGVWWPPFALAAIAPFALVARLSLPLAKACWAVCSILCLAWSVDRTGRWAPGRAVALALLAVALPIQYNFQHLNINAPLLALAVAAAEDWERNETRAGLWVALATALKVFPGLLILLFAFRRKWRAFAVSAAGAVLLTGAAMLPYGVTGAVRAVGRWMTLNLHATSYAGGAVAALEMQKLSRLVYAAGGGGVAAVAAHLTLLALAWWALDSRGGTGPNPRRDVGIALVVACLLSPIGWLHTFTLAYLLWVCALSTPERGRPRWRAALWLTAGVLTSGYLGKVPWPAPLAWVPGHNDTLGSILLLLLVATAPPPALSAPRPEPA